MAAVRRAPVGALILVWMWLASVGTPSTTSALQSGSANSTVHTLAGAVFTPSAIGAPTVALIDGVPRVSWQAVTLSSGVPASYVVTRTSDGAGASGACPPSLVSTGGGLVQCNDTAATGGATHSYTVQPYLDRGGTVTWTRPASSASNQVALPRLAYAGTGPAALFSGGSPTVVNYPAGTTQGDVLVLIARNARNKDISAPPGWTTVLSTARGNPASAFLVTWRIADAAASTTVAINSSNDGAVAWIVRYRRTAGVTGTPVVAHVGLVSRQSALTVGSFAASGLLTTTQGYASVLTIASTISAQVPSLTTGSGWTPQTGVSATSAGNGFSMALADRLAVTAGSQVASPTWQAPTATNTWEVVTLAFA